MTRIRNTVAACLAAITCATTAHAQAKQVDDRSLLFIFDQCADSHPSFDRIGENANAYGFDQVQVAPGHMRYNNPVEHPNSFLEVKSLQDGASFCMAYNANVPTSKAIADFNLLVLPQLDFGTPVQTAIDNAELAYEFTGMLYDLWVYISPMPGGGSAMVMQIQNADEQTAAAVTQTGQEINWKPGGGNPESDFRVGFGYFCLAAMPAFENSIPAMQNTGAVAEPLQDGHAVRWPDRVLGFYLQSATDAVPGICQVSSTDLSLAEVNNIARTQLSNYGAEETQPDGTRIWRFNPGILGTGGVAYSFVIADNGAAGIAFQVNNFDPSQW